MADWGDFHKASGAGWQLFWRIPDPDAGGLEIWWADFQGKRVLWKGTQPFAIVPYHHPIPNSNLPAGPQFAFKDGLGPQFGGVAFTAQKKWAPNGDNGSAWNAATDLDAVDVHVHPETSFDPAELTITAKFQCGWYQYVHRWEFTSYGEIHPHLGMGGKLHRHDPDKGHVHHMYFRIDLDIDGWASDVFEVFGHHGFDDNATPDEWRTVDKQGKHMLEPATSRKFRIRDLISELGSGAPPRGFEFEIPALGGTDTQSTADIWATVYRGDSVEQGEEVGAANCDDSELDAIAQGPLDTVNGSDVVAWVVVRHHHEPRHLAEEKDFLPYHYEGFHINARAFAFIEPHKGGDSEPDDPKPPH